MINEYGLKILVDKGNIFESVDIKGGVSYFLLDKTHKGECLYNNKLQKFENNLIVDTNDDELINNIKKFSNFSEYLISDQYFKIRNKDIRFNDDENNIRCFVSKQNGSIKHIKESELYITKNHNKYKVFIPTASGSKNNIDELGRLIIGYPCDVASRSFVHFSFNTLFECESFISYIETDIVKKLIKLKKQTQLVKKDCFSLVPFFET